VGILRESIAFSVTHNKRLIGILVAVGLILLVPLVAMQFTEDVVWSVGDFIVAGVLLAGTGLAFEVAVRKGGTLAYRAGAAVALGTALLLVWVNLAVGIIGSEDNDANLMYGGVLAVGVIGALLARFRPPGMARAMLATAVVQALVAAIALAGGQHDAEGSSVAEILLLNGFFVVLWGASALLFHAAAREDIGPLTRRL
jgi:hypothetical protein